MRSFIFIQIARCNVRWTATWMLMLEKGPRPWGMGEVIFVSLASIVSAIC